MKAPNGDCISIHHFKRVGNSPSDDFRDQSLWHSFGKWWNLWWYRRVVNNISMPECMKNMKILKAIQSIHANQQQNQWTWWNLWWLSMSNWWGSSRSCNFWNRNWSKFEAHSQTKQPQNSWTTLFASPFINHFREWAHFISYPFTNRCSKNSFLFTIVCKHWLFFSIAQHMPGVLIYPLALVARIAWTASEELCGARLSEVTKHGIEYGSIFWQVSEKAVRELL